MFYLEIILNEQSSYIFPLIQQVVYIGKSTNHIKLDSEFISATHCTLLLMQEDNRNNYYYLIFDGNPIKKKQSLNGVYVNGVRVNGSIRLEINNIITFASTAYYPRMIFLQSNIQQDEPTKTYEKQ